MVKKEKNLKRFTDPERKAARVKKGDSLACQEARMRGDMYRFLSAIFLDPPQEGLLKQVADKHFLGELSTLFGEKGVAGLKEFAVVPNLNKKLASLKQEYMDLFGVPTGRYVTPFEDVYRGKTIDDQQGGGPLLGERAIEVAKIYREAGAEMDQACKELPTHIGVELSFMSFLCEREASAIGDGEGDGLRDREKTKAANSARFREFQLRFLREHLDEWFPQLSQSIQAKAKSQFYRSLALIAESYLAQDTEHLCAQCGLEDKMGTQRTFMA